MKLTKHQFAVIKAVADWKAPFEVANMVYRGGPSRRQRAATETTLRKLRDLYLVSYWSSNGTYKATTRGLDALNS